MSTKYRGGKIEFSGICISAIILKLVLISQPRVLTIQISMNYYTIALERYIYSTCSFQSVAWTGLCLVPPPRQLMIGLRGTGVWELWAYNICCVKWWFFPLLLILRMHIRSITSLCKMTASSLSWRGESESSHSLCVIFFWFVLICLNGDGTPCRCGRRWWGG